MATLNKNCEIPVTIHLRKFDFSYSEWGYTLVSHPEGTTWTGGSLELIL
jgi:hypothetical protein